MANWAGRLGEGLLIGLGVTIVWVGFQRAQSAVVTMEGTSERLVAQQIINEKLLEEIAIAKNKLAVVERLHSNELKKINDTLDSIANKLEEEGIAGENRDLSFWNGIQGNASAQVKIPDIYQWYVPDVANQFKPAVLPSAVDLKKFNIEFPRTGDDSNVQTELWNVNPEQNVGLEQIWNNIKLQNEIPLK